MRNKLENKWYIISILGDWFMYSKLCDFSTFFILLDFEIKTKMKRAISSKDKKKLNPFPCSFYFISYPVYLVSDIPWLLRSKECLTVIYVRSRNSSLVCVLSCTFSVRKKLKSIWSLTRIYFLWHLIMFGIKMNMN